MPTKKDTADVLLRLPKAMIDKIDELRKTAEGFPSRQDVIRQILEDRLGSVEGAGRDENEADDKLLGKRWPLNVQERSIRKSDAARSQAIRNFAQLDKVFSLLRR